MAVKLTPQQKRAILLRRKKQRRRRQIRIALILLAAAAAIVLIIFLLAKPGGDRAETAQPTPEPTAALTAAPTQEPTPEPTPEPTATPTPAPHVPIHLYAPDDSGVRHLLTEYVSRWKKGKDIDCFEALASDAATLKGKNFYSICKEAWGSVPDPYAMKIGYTLRYTLADGSEIAMTIRKPSDILHPEYLEAYIYDDVHTSGFYTHLSDSNIKENTLITSIKLTCGEKIDQVQEIFLGVFLYDSDALFDAAGNYTGPWYNEIAIRRKN